MKKGVCDICEAITEVKPMARGQYCETCQPLICKDGNRPPMSICELCPSKATCEVK